MNSWYPRLPSETASFAPFPGASDAVRPTFARHSTAGHSEQLPPFLANLGTPGPEVLSAPVPELVDGRYDILAELAAGGMGRVFRAYDRVLNRNIALKILRNRFMDKDAVAQRFTEEAQIMARLQHPGIVPVYETGKVADGRPYIAMKLVEGCTLKDLLAERAGPRQDWADYIAIFEHVCQTVAYAHSRGVVHRDLKPENIMVGAFGEVQVMDWGLAKNCGPAEISEITPPVGIFAAGLLPEPEDDSPLEDAGDTKIFRVKIQPSARAEGQGTNVGQVLGTFQYMPPEQARGELHRLGFASDVFALGAVLCELLTGEPPYSSNKLDALRQAREADLKAARNALNDSGADADLVQLAKQCLNENPEDRPPDAEAVAVAIGGYLRGLQERMRHDLVRDVTAEAENQQAKARRQMVRRLREWVAVAAAVVFGILAVAGTLAIGYRCQRDELAEERRFKQQLVANVVDADLADVVGALNAPPDTRFGREALRQARRSLGRASEMLDGQAAFADPKQRERRDSLERRLARAEREAELRDRLDRVRQSDDENRPEFDRPRDTADGYAAAFADYAPEGPIPPEILAHLLNWYGATVSPRERERLAALIRFPSESQNRAFAHWAAASDKGDSAALAAIVPELIAAEFEPSSAAVFASGLRRRELFDAAERLLLSARPGAPDALYFADRELGLLYMAMPGRESDAVRYLTGAAGLRPKLSAPHVDLALALIKAGKVPEGVDQLKAALAIDPEDFAARWYMVRQLRQVGDYPEALEHFRVMLQHPGGLTLEALGRLRYAGAITAMQAAGMKPSLAVAARRDAFAWLSEQWSATAATRKSADRPFFDSWRTDVRLAPVRDAGNMQPLGESERAGWLRLWNEIGAWLDGR